MSKMLEGIHAIQSRMEDFLRREIRVSSVIHTGWAIRNNLYICQFETNQADFQIENIPVCKIIDYVNQHSKEKLNKKFWLTQALHELKDKFEKKRPGERSKRRRKVAIDIRNL